MAIAYFDSYAPTVSVDINPVTDGGKKVYSDLFNGRANRYVQILIGATVTIAGAVATAVINDGEIESLFSSMGIEEAGEEVLTGDGRAFRFSAEYMLQNSPKTRTRLTSTAIGAYEPRVQFRLWFENPQAVVPSETLYFEKNINQRLRFFATLATERTTAGSSPGSGRLFTGGGACVVTITNLNIRVQQLADKAASVDDVLFRPKVDRLDFPVGGVNANFKAEIPLATNQYLRGLTIIQESVAAGGGVAPALDSTILQSFQLRSDNYEYIGEGAQVVLDDFCRAPEVESGGDVYATNGRRIFHINFQKGGRLSRIMSPVQDSNLRLVFNVIAAPAGANIQVMRHLLVRDLWRDALGRRIMREQLPPDLLAA